MDIKVFSDELIAYGRRHGMQDLSIHPYKEQARISFRKSQQKTPYKMVPYESAQQLIARFKYLGEMDVGERRKVQLGAITYQTATFKQRLRLSTVGDYQLRESLVARFLYEYHHQGIRYFLPEQFELIAQNTQKRGLYLFSGPTGSGKTTLMYRLAQQEAGQVITIEDPVEIEEPTFLQLQTNPKISQTYDQLIQLSLRHRPDVLIIGEIRDQETAQAAIRAALTGHKVFATIHARGVNETHARIKDLVGDDSELQNCLEGIIYQQLLTDQASQAQALAAYTFIGHQLKKECFSWQEGLATLLAQGVISDELYQKESRSSETPTIY